MNPADFCDRLIYTANLRTTPWGLAGLLRSATRVIRQLCRENMRLQAELDAAYEFDAIPDWESKAAAAVKLDLMRRPSNAGRPRKRAA